MTNVIFPTTRTDRRAAGLLPHYNGARAVRDENGDVHAVYPDGRWYKAPLSRRHRTKGPAYYLAQRAKK